VEQVEQFRHLLDFPPFHGGQEVFHGMADGFDGRGVDGTGGAFQAVGFPEKRFDQFHFPFGGCALLQLDQAGRYGRKALLRLGREGCQELVEEVFIHRLSSALSVTA
jgi:hypothetical protein